MLETSEKVTSQPEQGQEAWFRLEQKLKDKGLSAEYQEIIENILSSKSRLLQEVFNYQKQTFKQENARDFINNLIFDENFIELLEEEVELNDEQQHENAVGAVKDTYAAYEEIVGNSDPLAILIKNFQTLREEPEKSYQEGLDLNLSDLINKRINAVVGLQDMIERYPQMRNEKYLKKLTDEKKKLAAILIEVARKAA